MVGVVHEGAVLPDGVFIFEGLTWLDSPLAQSSHTIHSAWQQNAMPMNARRSRQLIRHINANPVSLDALDGRAVNAAVEAPAEGAAFLVPFGFRNEDVIDFFADEVEYLHAIDHAKWQCGAVQSDGGFVIFARFARRERRFRPNRLDLLVKVIDLRFRRGLSAENGRQRGGSRKERGSADEISASENRLIVHRFLSCWVDFTMVLS